MSAMEHDEQQQIFDDWLEDYRGVFFKVVRAYALTPQDQEDLFQEIATQVWHSIPQFRGDAKASTWIYRVGLYTAMAWSKNEKRRRDNDQAFLDSEHLLLKPSERSSPQLDWLYDQINQLDRVDRSLTLMMLDGYSYREISSTLGITESHVGVKLNRIKKHLTKKSAQEKP